MKPIPILLTVRELDQGGIERDVTKIALRLDRSRFEPHVASYRAEGMRFEELRKAGIPYLHLPVSTFRSPAVFLAAMRMERYVRKRKIRLVHSWDPSAVFAVPIARLLRVPAVLSSMLGSRELLDPRTRRQVRWTDRMVDAVVVNCEAMRRHMACEEGFPMDRIELCYNGVDTTEFHPGPAVKHNSFKGASLVIGTVSVLRPEKSLNLLQEAFGRIRHLRAGMKLMIVGSGPELPRLETNSRRLGLQNECVLVPATPKIADFLRVFDIFVSSSSSEAFSNSILEAMACGICPVGSRVGGTPELIGNDERGLLFESGNPDDLAAKLRTLIENGDIRRELGTRAAEFARTRLKIEIAASRMADIYETILRKKEAWSGPLSSVEMPTTLST